jgi:hypothetical protein
LAEVLERSSEEEVGGRSESWRETLTEKVTQVIYRQLALTI